MKYGSFRLSERSVLAIMGWVCGMAVGLLLYFTWKANEFLLTFPPLGGLVLALWYAERTGKMPTADEANRLIRLFDEHRQTKKS